MSLPLNAIFSFRLIVHNGNPDFVAKALLSIIKESANCVAFLSKTSRPLSAYDDNNDPTTRIVVSNILISI